MLGDRKVFSQHAFETGKLWFTPILCQACAERSGSPGSCNLGLVITICGDQFSQFVESRPDKLKCIRELGVPPLVEAGVHYFFKSVINVDHPQVSFANWTISVPQKVG